jgi:cell fate regulator YaaT (PSP1 superfamily)
MRRLLFTILLLALSATSFANEYEEVCNNQINAISNVSDQINSVGYKLHLIYKETSYTSAEKRELRFTKNLFKATHVALQSKGNCSNLSKSEAYSLALNVSSLCLSAKMLLKNKYVQFFTEEGQELFFKNVNALSAQLTGGVNSLLHCSLESIDSGLNRVTK